MPALLHCPNIDTLIPIIINVSQFSQFQQVNSPAIIIKIDSSLILEGTNDGSLTVIAVYNNRQQRSKKNRRYLDAFQPLLLLWGERCWYLIKIKCIIYMDIGLLVTRVYVFRTVFFQDHIHTCEKCDLVLLLLFPPYLLRNLPSSCLFKLAWNYVCHQPTILYRSLIFHIYLTNSNMKYYI